MVWRQTWPVDSNPDSVSETRGRGKREREKQSDRLVPIRDIVHTWPDSGSFTSNYKRIIPSELWVSYTTPYAICVHANLQNARC